MKQLKYLAVLMVLLKIYREKGQGYCTLLLVLIMTGNETFAQSSYTYTLEKKTCIILERDSNEKYTIVDSIGFGGYPLANVVSVIGNRVYVVDIMLRNGFSSYVLKTWEIINDSLQRCETYFSSTWGDSRLSVKLIGSEFVLTYKENPLSIMPTAQERYFLNDENISDFARIVTSFWNSNKTQKPIRK